MRDQLNSPHQYRLDLVFPPWDGHLPWALPWGMGGAAPEQQR
jgi:hypothetical protein